MRKAILVLAVAGAAAALILVFLSPGTRHIVRREPLDELAYDRAERIGRSEVDAARAAFGDRSLEAARASDVLVRALLENGRGWSTDTLALAQRTVRDKEALLGLEHINLTPSLINLGDVLVAAADYEPAIATLGRASALQERATGSESDALADVLDHLGAALTSAGRYEDAFAVLERSLRIKEARSEPDAVAVARTLEAVGAAAQRAGLYERSGATVRRADEIRRRAGPSSPAYVGTLILVSQQLWYEGLLAESRDVSAQAVALAEQTLRPTHPLVPEAIRYLAGTLADLGDLDRSLELRQRALLTATREFGGAHHETAVYLNSAAIGDLALGDYIAARRRFEQALASLESRYGPWHDWVATARLNVALVDARLGDYEDARREHERATAIWERALGRNHPFVAVALTELATVYREQGLASQALPLLERALSIRERNLGLDHPDTGRTLVDLASTLSQMGERQRARSLARRALLVWERLDVPNAPEYAQVLALYADIQHQAGQDGAAKEYFERALRIRGRAFGVSSPLYAEAEAGLSLALASQGESMEALRAAVHVETVGREHLKLLLRSLPERQALNYAAARPRGLSLMLSLAGVMPDAVPVALDALVRSRAVVLDEIAARQRASHVRQEGMDLTQSAWRSAQQRLANLIARGPGPMSPAQFARVVEDTRGDRERAEEALAERSAEFRAERTRDRIGLEQVAAALPDGSALLSFARYDRELPGAGALPRRSDNRSRALRSHPTYVVFVTRAAGAPVVVSLGPVNAIDAQVLRWRADVAAEAQAPARGPSARSARSSRASGEALRRLVWDPLSPHLRDARRVFVVPDGTLGLVSFAALPVGRARYVVEEDRILHYLSAERDLVLAPPARVAEGGLLAVGGPSFDDATLFGRAPRAATDPKPTASPRFLRAGTQDCAGFQTIAFEPLPGTLQEVDDVSGLWSTKSDAASEPARVLIGARATETAFKEEAPGYRVLHLATHGFFIGDGCPTSDTRAMRGVGGLISSAPSAQADNPLLLSGLALAGANRRASARPDEDEGILTAEEVASLDLGGVEWAVLSACDTGVGEVRAGEGVFGLRRAFQVAGARTVIMSLWSVEDQAARAWMHLLYEGRFQKGLPTADAVHNASLTMLRDRRARGFSTDPFYWAAFVAAGDWH